jgi:opacity protein-like surface antigen
MAKYAVLMLILMTCLPSLAFGERGGFYVGGQLGASLIDTVESVGVTGSSNLNPAAGGVGSLLVGYDYADNTPRFAQGRVELELSWRQNPLDTIEFAGGEVAAGGDLAAHSAMLNFFYESHGLTPLLAYYGVGVGVARVALDQATVGGLPLADDADAVPAWQIGLGLGYRLGSRLTVDAGYRFFATQDPEFEDVRGRKFSTEYQSHTILLGARYLF